MYSSSYNDGSGVKIVVSLVTLGLLALIPTCGACNVSEEHATTILAPQGFTEVHTQGYAWIGCGDDTFGSHFTAVNAAGEPVEGVICCGWLKSCTVRW